MTDFLTINELSLEYITFGEGSTPLLSFHGFGRTADDFLLFKNSLGKKYKILSFNLFHHGKSAFPEKRDKKEPLTKEELRSIIHQLSVKEGIDRFSVLGYSMGGKFAMVIAELFPEKVNEIWLFAPDGLQPNLWYLLVSRTKLGMEVYSYFTRRTPLLFSIVRILTQIRLIHPKLEKFVQLSLDTPDKIEKVKKVWYDFREIKPDVSLLARSIKTYNISAIQFYGKNDKVISAKYGLSFARKINQEDNFILLDAGHALLTAQTNQIVEDYLFKK